VNFGQFLQILFITFFMICYLMVLFTVVGDLFRNHNSSGWAKAGWIIGLVFIPFITLLAYVIVNHKGMAERQQASAKAMESAQAEYVKKLAGTASPADSIQTASNLLASGAITQAEFDQIKAKALASA
jgi:hypothetical protein